ncbi:hypothetical protein NBRC110019_22840 [Neptunitalea chrysea]|uniref:Uncharacterized protein n=1 Tax=Neptunitalea chrysea TaxID=1647581 RepID=A0A9W6B5X9_9FLAO|nr:DUF6048 family protein [Neptunitalea chrysea]GLB53244.1 hypothetical protein NBRC110019_22840 [Neptunitalea chrysea]
MKIKHTLVYITSILFGIYGYAQNTDTTTTTSETPTDSVVYKQRYGLRVGVDLSRLVRSYTDDDYQGLEIVGDYRLNHNWFAAAEIGSEKKTTDEDYYNFTTKGNYIKVGADINTYDNWYGMENVISLGFRYGFATMSQTVNSYTPYVNDPYWGEGDTSGINTDILREYSGLSAHWVEFVVSMKVELLHNIYLGGSVRINKLLTDKAGGDFPNLWIPGFNKVTDGSSIGMGYNYSITYLIPLYKKSKSQEQKKTEEKEKAPKK